MKSASPKNVSFKTKMLLSSAVPTAAALALLTGAVLASEWLEWRRSLPRNLGIQADVLAMNATGALTFDDRSAAREILSGLRADDHVVLAAIQRADTEEFARFEREDAWAAPAVNIPSPGYRFARERLHLSRPIVLDGETIGSVYLQYDLRPFYRELGRMVALTLGGMVLALGAAFLVSRRLQGALVQPVTELARVAHVVSERNDYTVRAAWHSADEFGRLTAAFNHMLSRIQERDRAIEATNANLEFLVAARTVALQESEERMQSLIRDVDGILWEADPATLRYSFVSQRAESILGYPVERWLREPDFWVNLIHPDDREQVVASVHEATNRGHDHEFSYRAVAVNGHVVWLHDFVRIVRDERGILRLRGLMVNITEQKQVEAALEAALVKAHAADRAKSDFLANMSHEIRTPLNGVIGMTELLLNTGLDVEQRAHLQTVLECSNSLLTLLNEILDLSKIGAGKLELESVDVDPVQLVEGVVGFFARSAANRNVEFICDVDPSVPPRLRGDPGRLRQVLMNLAGNAVKFTSEGEIVISMGVERAWAEHVMLQVAVRDSGIGIPADRLEAIFESFAQVDSSTTRKYGGTGLGLAITKQLVELMNGSIWVRSELGKGSVFGFRVPLEVAAGADQSDAGSRATNAGVDRLTGARALIVDDNATSRLVLRRLLESWHVVPVEAAGGAEALEALEFGKANGLKFNVVLLDVQMPNMDGFEVARRIRKDPDFEAVKIFFLSSMGGRHDLQQRGGARFDACLTKPIRRAALREALTGLLEGEGPFRSASITERPFPHGPTRRRAARSRILLVDDNAINRRVATELLHKLGHDVTEAEDGRAAIELLNRMSFDLVLMDLQMPNLDGMAATKRIRQEAKWKDLPIIAMTAHAMKGDAQRCLAVGMNDYLSKPISLLRLKEMLKRWTQGSNRRSSAQSAQPTGALDESNGDDAETPADLALALTQLGGDGELLDTVAAAFLETMPEIVAELRDACGRADARRLSAAAHNLRGAASQLCAGPAERLARQLEVLARGAQFDAVDSTLSSLESQLARLRRLLESAQRERVA